MAESWRVCRLGDAVQRETTRVGMDRAPEVLSSTKHQGLVPSRTYFKGRQIFSDDLSTYRVVEPGWFAYATNHLAEGSIGLNNLGETGCVSPMYTVFSTRQHVDQEYLYHLLKSSELLSQYQLHEQASVDRRGSIRFNSFAEIPIMLPPLEEQRRIAEILGTIDETIQATERVITKLTVVRTGVLCAALEAAVPTSHQSTVQREFEIVTGITLNAGRVPRFNPVGYLRVANVHRGKVDISDLAVLEATEGDVMRKGLAPGDLLVVEGHASPNEIGRCALVPRVADGLLFQNHLFRLRSRSIMPDVAELILNSAEARAYWRRRCATSSGLHTINSSMLRAMPILVPGRDHQLFLSKLCNRTDNPVSAEWRRLEKLREVRCGLAADLLSGRVPTVAA